MPQSWEELQPRLRSAEDSFRNEQLESFVGIEPPICGIEVLPFTPTMFVELDLCGNAFLAGGREITAGDIGAFLWRVSPYFSRTNENLKRAFIANILTVDGNEAAKQILAYLDRASAPAPLTKRSIGNPVAAWPSFLVHTFGKEYGWDESKTLNYPLRRLYQYLNRIIEAADPEFKQRCPAALALREGWLIEQNEKRTATA